MCFALKVVGKLSNIDCLTEGKAFTDPVDVCPVCGESVGMLEWTEEAVVRVLSVSREADDVLFPPGRGNSIVVSDRFREVYEINDCTGLGPFETVRMVGSMRALKRIGPRQYDAFGNLTGTTGTWPGPFGYAGGFGYQEDAESGLMLLGHRYYDSTTGRWLSRDPTEARTLR